MQNYFTKYLIDNNWEQIRPMTFTNNKYYNHEIFFDSSNQIELYYLKDRIDEKYLLVVEDLKNFLERNSLVC